MPDTNDTDAILAKVRSGELSAGDAAALIANLAKGIPLFSSRPPRFVEAASAYGLRIKPIYSCDYMSMSTC